MRQKEQSGQGDRQNERGVLKVAHFAGWLSKDGWTVAAMALVVLLGLVELKKEVNELARQLGQPPPYPLAFLRENDSAAAPEQPERR